MKIYSILKFFTITLIIYVITIKQEGVCASCSSVDYENLIKWPDIIYGNKSLFMIFDSMPYVGGPKRPATISVLPKAIGERQYGLILLTEWIPMNYKRKKPWEDFNRKTVYEPHILHYIEYPSGDYTTKENEFYDPRELKKRVIYKTSEKFNEEVNRIHQEEKSRDKNAKMFSRRSLYLQSIVLEHGWLIRKERKDKEEELLERDVAKKLRIIDIDRKSREGYWFDEEKYAPEYFTWMKEKTKDDPIFNEVEEIK